MDAKETGVFLVIFVPSPISPFKLLPHPHATPDPTARECVIPADISVIPVREVIKNEEFLNVKSPVPSCPN
jgi:hypothetical protein